MSETAALKMQRDSLRDALRKVLDTHEAEAKAFASWQNALENFSDGGARECAAHTRAMTAASNAEREARVLLLTLKPDA